MAETVTAQERAEEQAFLTAVTATRPMQYVHQYLARKVLRTLAAEKALHAWQPRS